MVTEQMMEIGDTAGLNQLPDLSVVQFRGAGLGPKNRVVWQLDEEWFSPGSTESVAADYFPPTAFPAVVLWSPGLTGTTPPPGGGVAGANLDRPQLVGLIEGELERVWDEGNATGLDGWIGPGRGAGEVDGHAVAIRQRATHAALERILNRLYPADGSPQ